MIKPPGWKLPAQSKEEVDRVYRNRGRMSDHLLDEEDSRPLKFKQTVPLRKKEKWKKRKKRGSDERPDGFDFVTVWRMNGLFARRPEPGDRARQLGLTKRA